MSDRPTHLILEPSDLRTLCGLRSRKVTPVMVARFYAQHRANYELTVCPQCDVELTILTQPPQTP